MLMTNDNLGLIRSLLPRRARTSQMPTKAPPGRGSLAEMKGLSRKTSPERVSLSAAAGAASAQNTLETSMADKVREMFSEYGIEQPDYAGVDFSPQATAQRIFGFASGMMSVYADQHPELSGDELIDSFESTIRGAVDEGYGEAIEILQGMQMSDEVLSTAEETKSILDGLFDDFFSDLRGGSEAETAAETVAQTG